MLGALKEGKPLLPLVEAPLFAPDPCNDFATKTTKTRTISQNMKSITPNCFADVFQLFWTPGRKKSTREINSENSRPERSIQLG